MKKHFNDPRGNWSRRLFLFYFLAIFSSAAFAQSPAAPEEKPAHALNPMQIALLKWSTNTITSFRVGQRPSYIAFDGTHIWVTNNFDNTVAKLRASDGSPQGRFSVGRGPEGVAFDGANTWVANFSSNTARKF